MAAGEEHPFAGLVRDRGGAVVGRPERLDDPAPDGVSFLALLASAQDISPPLARLRAAEMPAFLLTAGRVGGGEEEPGSRSIPLELVSRALDAALAGEVAWECDPDFGFELPVDFPGLEPDERLTLVPRFLYARTDRVYSYAALAPQAQAGLAGEPSR